MFAEEFAEEAPSEDVRVEAWRADQLLRAGFPDAIALELAGRFDVDLHRAVDLVLEHGCAPELAARILA